jgi:hypothetical protein
MEQMMACLTEMKTNQAKADANLQEMEEEITASQEHPKEEMLAKMETNQERMDAKIRC